jgi:hypothetical protein
VAGIDKREQRKAHGRFYDDLIKTRLSTGEVAAPEPEVHPDKVYLPIISPAFCRPRQGRRNFVLDDLIMTRLSMGEVAAPEPEVHPDKVYPSPLSLPPSAVHVGAAEISCSTT